MNSFHRIMAIVLIHIAMGFERWSFWHNEKVKCTFIPLVNEDIEWLRTMIGVAASQSQENNKTIH